MERTAALTAIVKPPTASLCAACELTFIERSPMQLEVLEQQHLEYRHALEQAGARVTMLEPSPDLPDSVFVEDTALVLEEIAIISRPGSDSRLPETVHLEPALAQHRRLAHIHAPGMLEGGDVLRVGRKLFVGVSTRTNLEGIRQLERIVQPLGYSVVPVNVPGALHLKTACTALDANTVIFNPDWVDANAFQEFTTLHVAANEPFGANVLPVGDVLIVNAAFPETLETIRNHSFSQGTTLIPVNISEFGKAEAGLTCMSLIFNA
jgi:dimethylargininase